MKIVCDCGNEAELRSDVYGYSGTDPDKIYISCGDYVIEEIACNKCEKNLRSKN